MHAEHSKCRVSLHSPRMKSVIYEGKTWSAVPRRVDRCFSIVSSVLCTKAEMISEHVLPGHVKGEQQMPPAFPKASVLDTHMVSCWGQVPQIGENQLKSTKVQHFPLFHQPHTSGHSPSAHFSASGNISPEYKWTNGGERHTEKPLWSTVWTG